MRVGVDFDNTIVDYDRVFHRVACERGLIAPEVPATKASVRRALVEVGREDDWTEMQGYVYGARMLDAEPFPGVLDFFRRCVAEGVDVAIVSHKTLHPYRGPRYDLHRAAQGWLEHHGFYDPGRIGLGRERVFFELTKPEKLDRIALLGCTHFIDDLPEILCDERFPDRVARLLFDPAGHHGDGPGLRRFGSWTDLENALAAGSAVA